MTDFTPCEKRTQIDIPEGGMAIVFKNEALLDDGAEFTLQTYHNFPRETKDFTMADKMLWFVCQGILDTANKSPDALMHRGFQALREFFDKNGLDLNQTTFGEGVDVADAPAAGSA